MALLLPPLARRDLGRAPLDLARERERGAPDDLEGPARLDAHPDVDASRAARLRPADEAHVGEHVARHQRDVDDLLPRYARDGIEVDAELVRVVHVLGPHGVRVEVDAAEVDHPRELRHVAHDDLVCVASGREPERRHLDPVGSLRGRALLVERLLLDAVREALEEHRAPADAAHRAVGDGDVVADEVELGQPELREEDLRRVGDRDLTSRELEHLGLRIHGDRLRGRNHTLGRAARETAPWSAARVTLSGAGRGSGAPQPPGPRDRGRRPSSSPASRRRRSCRRARARRRRPRGGARRAGRSRG